MKNVRNRIQKILKKEQVTVNALAMSYGENQAKLNNQINAETTISVNTILIVLDKFPNISAEWLLRGTGSMLLTEPHHETLTGEIRDDSETIAALKETIAAQKIAIVALTDEVHVLKGDIVVPHRSVKTA